MNFEAYKVTVVPYPERPLKPERPRNLCGRYGREVVEPNSEQYREFSDALRKYEKDMNDFLAARDKYDKTEKCLLEKFREDALEEVGLSDRRTGDKAYLSWRHPKADKAYAFAWKHGHADGLSNVFYWLQEAANLLKKDE